MANKVRERMNHTITFEKILWSLRNFSQFWGFVMSFLLLFCRLGSSKLVKKTNNKIWLLFKLKRVFCVLPYLAFCFMNFVSVCFLSKWQIFLQESSSRFEFISFCIRSFCSPQPTIMKCLHAENRSVMYWKNKTTLWHWSYFCHTYKLFCLIFLSHSSSHTDTNWHLEISDKSFNKFSISSCQWCNRWLCWQKGA